MDEAQVLAEYLTQEQLEDLLADWIAVLDAEEDKHIDTIKEAIKIIEGEWK